MARIPRSTAGNKPVSKRKKAILVYLDEDLIKDLKVAAVERETSASAITAEAVGSWLQNRGFRRPRSDG